ncbi:MAG TPA: hypothetical protein VM939_13580, partial [Gemmatimonadaceae bacterium]|nr:hypothetical protein [Gemmatimonadaceae bacterium]
MAEGIPNIVATEATPETGAVPVTVILVAIGSLAHIERALDALLAQNGAPQFELIVSADPELGDIEPLRGRYPTVTMLAREGCRTPIELTTAGLKSARGERILLTEDSCVAHRDWVRTLSGSEWRGRAAVGGAIEPMPDVSPAMWAFYYVDFFRYMKPLEPGPSPSLSVCNVAYHRTQLDAVANLWESGFHETEIHRALQERFGSLYLEPAAEVHVRRTVSFKDAVYERYAFGRLFAATRVAYAGAGRRVYYMIFSPALPILLMGRMTAKALKSKDALPMFIRALPSLLSMVFAWTWGEWLGYLTRRRPRRITTAPEVDVAAAKA